MSVIPQLQKLYGSGPGINLQVNRKNRQCSQRALTQGVPNTSVDKSKFSRGYGYWKKNQAGSLAFIHEGGIWTD